MPLNAYNLYQKMRFKEIKAAYPDLTAHDVTRQVCKEYQNMTPAQREELEKTT